MGKIKIIDRDCIECHNLQRQVLFDEGDIKNQLPKAFAAERHLRKVNSTIEIEGIVVDLGIPGRIVEDSHKTTADLEHGKLPDPVAAAIRIVIAEQGALRERLARIEIFGKIIVPTDVFNDKIQEIVLEFNDGERI